jgi:aspartokinase
METIAIYWEPRIKTYGFQKFSGLALIEYCYPIHEIKSVGEIFSHDALHTIEPRFIIAQESGHEISFTFCLSEKEGKGLHASLENTLSSNFHRYVFPVGIIFFHGPHFGDRYGIADATFSSLSKAGIAVIASGCSSSSVYVIVIQGDMDRAEEALAQTFEVVH